MTCTSVIIRQRLFELHTRSQACHINVYVDIDILNLLYLHCVALNSLCPLSSFVRTVLLLTLSLSFALVERLPKDVVYHQEHFEL